MGCSVFNNVASPYCLFGRYAHFPSADTHSIASSHFIDTKTELGEKIMRKNNK